MTDLSTKQSRKRLPPRGALYTHVLEGGRALGYRRRSQDKPGKWILRMAKPAGGYGFEVLGTADDKVDADGETILSYAQALDAALGRSKTDPTKIKVADALEDWAEAKALRASSPKQVLDLKSTARRISRAFPSATLNSITVQQIAAWMTADLRAARATKNRELASLKAALTRAADIHGYEGKRAWLAAKKHDRASSFGSRPVILTQDEEERLIGAAEPATGKLLRALQMTGARFGELRQVLVGDLEGTRLDISAGKTGPRVITLSPDKAEWFRFVAGNRPRREHLLLREDGTPWPDGGQLKPVRRAVEAAELPADITCYALRHGFISRALARGVPVVAVAKHCGTSVEMISATYAKFAADEMSGWFS